MPTTTWIISLVASVGLSLAAVSDASAQEAAATPTTAPAKFDPLQSLSFDLDKRTVTVQCKVSLATGPVEFLLCRAATKEYESVLSTTAIPSSLHGLLLAMGLSPGKPARTIYPDGEKPIFLPPRGPKLTLTVRWTAAPGEVHEIPAQDLLAWRQYDGAPKNENKTPIPDHWVFVGSYLTPDGLYLADREGELISVSNFGSSTIDVPFESSSNNALLSYQANPDKVPAKGTAVELVIHVAPDAENEPHARAMVEVDRFGRFRADDKVLNEDGLIEWAATFVRAHAKAEVLLRVDERALAGDIVRAKHALKMGGIWDVNDEIIFSFSEPLPRTPEQAKDSLAVWSKRFAAGQRLIRDPVGDAETLLQTIRQHTEEAQAIQVLWTSYAKEITKGLEQYKTSTQPAK